MAYSKLFFAFSAGLVLLLLLIVSKPRYVEPIKYVEICTDKRACGPGNTITEIHTDFHCSCDLGFEGKFCERSSDFFYPRSKLQRRIHKHQPIEGSSTRIVLPNKAQKKCMAVQQLVDLTPWHLLNHAWEFVAKRLFRRALGCDQRDVCEWVATKCIHGQPLTTEKRLVCSGMYIEAATWLGDGQEHLRNETRLFGDDCLSGHKKWMGHGMIILSRSSIVLAPIGTFLLVCGCLVRELPCFGPSAHKRTNRLANLASSSRLMPGWSAAEVEENTPHAGPKIYETSNEFLTASKATTPEWISQISVITPPSIDSQSRRLSMPSISLLPAADCPSHTPVEKLAGAELHGKTDNDRWSMWSVELIERWSNLIR